MYEVNEKEILKQAMLGDLFVAYSRFEYTCKSIDLTLYLEFFWQVYYSLTNTDYSTEEFNMQYIFRFDKFDPEIFDRLFFMLQNVVKKYGIRMDRVPSENMMCIHFTKKLNNRIYYVDNKNDLEWIKNSIAA